ncbi:MAG TPA: VOC family protein [Acidimicrobiales bacterium]|nr:VOC family protein [Acidimicrobiales bacterium]
MSPRMHATVDHLLYGTPDLELGIGEIERLTGIRPRYGGQHLGLGTHNALLSLGDRTYLEVIAPDPSQSRVEAAPPYGIGSLVAPALRAWAAAPDDIEVAVRMAREVGIDYGDVSAHSRKAPGGGDVRWRMATRSIRDDALAIVPFLIDWGSTPHPSEGAPAGVRLVEFRVLVTEPDDYLRQLRAIGAEVPVSVAEEPGLVAVVVGPSGREVVLRS